MDRKQLVGLLNEDMVRLQEAQLVSDQDQPVRASMVTHVTCSYYLDAVGRPIVLTLIAGGQDRIGETVHIPMPARTIAARITPPVLVDPDNTRLKI